MRKGGRHSSIFPIDDLERLRQILIYANKKSMLSRATIAREADIKAVDLDNFTTLDSRADPQRQKYKSEVPRTEFQQRVLYFVLNNQKLRAEAENKDSPISFYYQALARYRNEAKNFRGEDDLFNHFLKINLVRGQTDLLRLSERISGNYFAYRPLPLSNRVMISHINIPAVNNYQKVPSFIHRAPASNGGAPIVSKGIIYEIDREYIFQGLILGPEQYKTREHLGIQVFIVARRTDRMSSALGIVLDGVFLTRKEPSLHEFGKIHIVRTPEKFSRDKIRCCEREELPFRYDELFLRPQNREQTLIELRHTLEFKLAN